MPIQTFMTSRVFSTTVDLEDAFGVFVAKGVALGIESGYGLTSTDEGVTVWLEEDASVVAENAGLFLGIGGVREAGHTLNVAAGALLHGFIDAGAILHGVGTVVHNAGTIRGLHYGLTTFGDGAEKSNTVVNSGLIEASLHHGFLASGSTRTEFDNAGTVKGKAGSYRGGSGVDYITNTGSMVGGVGTANGNDFIDTRLGSIIGVIDLGEGADTAQGSGAADIVLGGAGNDRIIGNGGKVASRAGLDATH